MERITLKLNNYIYHIDIIISKKIKGTIDAFYFLDGQNAFKDSYATFHKSLKAKKHLNKLHKPYLAIAIHSPNNLERFSLYTPFKLKDINNNTMLYDNFINDLTKTIMPKLEANYNIKNRYLITSSLATLPALALSNYYNGIALFSSAFFLNYEETKKLININKTYNFIAVGDKEHSDYKYGPNDYLSASNWYYSYCLKNNINADLYIHHKGKHDEKSWRKYLKIFIKKIREF